MVVVPAVIGSCAAVILLAKTAITSIGLERWRHRRLVRPRARSLRGPGRGTEDSLAGLRDAIVGNGKREISSVFGPPHSAAVRGAHDTWYYPLRDRERLAMAISFNNDLAREVEFFHPPVKQG